MILNKLGLSNNSQSCIIISSYPTTHDSIELTKKSILAAKLTGYPVILATHCDVPKELSSICDEVVIDKNNILTYHDYYCNYWNETHEFKVKINLRENGNHIYHGPAVYTNYFNGVKTANRLNYSKCILTNFDFILSNESVDLMFSKLGSSNGVFHHEVKQEGECLTTAFCAVSSKFFLDVFPEINSEANYTDWKIRVNSESNGLENMFFHTLSNTEIIKISDQEYKNLLDTSNYDICSQVEYFTFLEVENENDSFAIWYNTSDPIINSKIRIVVLYDSKVSVFDVDSNYFYKIFEKSDKPIAAFLIKDTVQVRHITSRSPNFLNNGSILLK
jgi:hypothetical protein